MQTFFNRTFSSLKSADHNICCNKDNQRHRFLSDIDYESDRTCFGKPQTAVTSLQSIHQTLFLSINGLEEESNKIIDNYIFLSH